jgi:hypothetical protein
VGKVYSIWLYWLEILYYVSVLESFKAFAWGLFNMVILLEILHGAHALFQWCHGGPRHPERKPQRHQLPGEGGPLGRFPDVSKELSLSLSKDY